MKKDRTPVTEYDEAIEQYIRQEIRKKYPDHSIKGEELDDEVHDSSLVWRLDPIDGTTNFSIGYPAFGAMITVCYEDEPLVAVVYLPVSNTLYSAVKNQGYYLDDVRIEATYNPLSDTTAFIERGGSSFGKAKSNHLDYLHKNHGLFRSWRRFGAMALTAPYLNSIHFGAIVVFGAPHYDLLPTVLFGREAGYLVCNFMGLPWSLRDKDLIVVHEKNMKMLVDTLSEYSSRK